MPLLNLSACDASEYSFPTYLLLPWRPPKGWTKAHQCCHSRNFYIGPVLLAVSFGRLLLPTAAELLSHPLIFSIPTLIDKAITQLIRSKTEISSNEVKAVIEALDGEEDERVCKRLDTRALSIVCGVLRLSAPCQAQRRGFFLLAVVFPHSLPQADKLTTSRNAYMKIPFKVPKRTAQSTQRRWCWGNSYSLGQSEDLSNQTGLMNFERQ